MRSLARKERTLALLCYLGVVPAALYCKKKHPSDYCTLHAKQALVLFGFLAIIVVLLAVLVLLLSYGMVHHRQLVERWPSEVWLLSLGRKLLIVWAVFWGYAVVRAVRGSAVPVPYLSRALRSRWLPNTGAIFVVSLVVIAVVMCPIVVRAHTLTTEREEAGKVFVVYDDLGRFPRFLFSFAVYPITRSAVARHGHDSVVMAPMTRTAIKTALTQGTFVIIASHGTAQGLLLEEGYFTPDDVPPLHDHTPLQFVYLAGCDSGAQRQAWETALYPATVKTYDRLTPVIEHLWWFWIEGPKHVRAYS